MASDTAALFQDFSILMIYIHPQITVLCIQVIFHRDDEKSGEIRRHEKQNTHTHATDERVLEGMPTAIR